ncbi:MAG: hypothetical protein C0599_18085 [Salinivirgaceae bacterium]|nr:MAG: hypothetical protein C0599_18085 [Salinivirgaceae bacterium]
MIKTSIIILLLILFSTPAFSQEIISDAKIKFDLPNEKWALKSQKEVNGKTLFIYKRDPIQYKRRSIIPNISIITESVNDSADAVTYSIQKRMQAPFNIEKVFTWEDETIKFQNAIGYLAAYEDQYGKHKIYVIHAINNGIGLQFFFDVTEDVFKKVKPEFQATMKSISEIE